MFRIPGLHVKFLRRYIPKKQDLVIERPKISVDRFKIVNKLTIVICCTQFRSPCLKFPTRLARRHFLRQSVDNTLREIQKFICINSAVLTFLKSAMANPVLVTYSILLEKMQDGFMSHVVM